MQGSLGAQRAPPRPTWAPPPAASPSCGENPESSAPGREDRACPVAQPGAGRPKIPFC
jgi:hypothetical protein